MQKLYPITLALGVLLTAPVSEAADRGVSDNGRLAPTSIRYRAKGPQRGFDSQRAKTARTLSASIAGTVSKAASATPDVALPGSAQFSYLDGPNGETWFYTTEFEYTEIVESEYYTRKELTGYKFDIYKPDYTLFGTVKNKITLDTEAGQTGVAGVSLGGVISQKFFNYDNNYEVMVETVYNTVDYTNESETLVYAVNGEKDAEGNDIAICTQEGRLVDMLDISDRWTENFIMTFSTEWDDASLLENPDATYQEYLDSYILQAKVYKKAGYGGGPQVILQKDFKRTCLPGDQMSVSPIISGIHDGKPFFMMQEYDKSFYAPVETFEDFFMSDPVMNTDINLKVEIYQPPYATGTPELIQTTMVPVDKDAGPTVLYTYFSVGSMGFDKDINFTDYGTEANKAALVITKENYVTTSDSKYETSYYVYSPAGEPMMALCEQADSYIGMSSIAGENPQALFVKLFNNQYEFYFTDLITGEVVLHTPNIIDNESVSANIDRVAVGDGYMYVAELTTPGLDDNGNDMMRVAWITADGHIDHIDYINMGKNIALAQVYIEQNALTPYLFNTDSAHEYMVLVKRRDAVNTTIINEELLIGQPVSETLPEGNTIFTALIDEEKGAIRTIMLMDANAEPSLLVLYHNDETGLYYQDFYRLPFSKFVGGEGTPENPYKIATVGDLQQIKGNLTASYELACDIDASGFGFASVGTSSTPFKGTFDGKGHTISNLSLANGALFAYAQDATIKDVAFVNVNMNVEDCQSAGVVAKETMSSEISGIHILGLTVNAIEGDPTFGSITGVASQTTRISGCSVGSAFITIPEGSNIGGIVGRVSTSSSISNCAFTGKIEALSAVGGILGEVATGNEVVADCHVDAEVKARNTVGGIVGSFSRRGTGRISRCYVEGVVEATSPAMSGLKAGGVLGELAAFYSEEEGVETPVAIEGCMVNLEAINIPEGSDLSERQNSVHRIVGMTSEVPSEIDWENTTDWENPIYLPGTTEAGLSNNYAISSLSRFDTAASADKANTEGGDVDADNLNNEFFSGLGWRFGNDAENPWNEIPEYDPSLYIEASARFVPEELTVEQGAVFTANMVINSRKQLTMDDVMDGLTISATDEGVAFITGNADIKGNVLSIELEAYKEGTTVIDVYVGNVSGRLKVNVKKAESGIESVVTPGSDVAISFDGSQVSSPAASIEIYSVAGVKLAAGYDAVSTASLAPGIYVVVARTETASATRKIAVK